MLKQFVKFALVGVLNTAIHYGVFYSLFEFAGLYYVLASGIGFGLAVTNSYFCNKFWTFKSRKADVRREFAKFFIVNIVSLSINLACMAVLVELFAMYPPVAQLVTIGITLVINFLGNKFWTFKE
jgi:putative flippase GtrA